MMFVLLAGTCEHHLEVCLANQAGWSLLTPSSVNFLNVFFSGASSVSKMVVSSFARLVESSQFLVTFKVLWSISFVLQYSMIVVLSLAYLVSSSELLSLSLLESSSESLVDSFGMVFSFLAFLSLVWFPSDSLSSSSSDSSLSFEIADCFRGSNVKFKGRAMVVMSGSEKPSFLSIVVIPILNEREDI